MQKKDAMAADSAASLCKKNMKAEIKTVRTRTHRHRKGLIRFARDIKSQGGEDGIIAAIFGCLDATQSERWCVDVGAWDGVHLSNTYNLLCAEGTKWRGALVEADVARAEALEALHRPRGNVAIAATASCEDPARSVPSLLARFAPAAPKAFDLLSVDVDGCDYWLLADFFASPYSARVVVVEFNPSMPHALHYVPPRSDAIRHGASLAALNALATANGYFLAETTVYNAFFVDAAARDALLAAGYLRADDDVDTLHEVSMGTSLYQLYSGELKVHGCAKLLWHRAPIDERRLQMVDDQGFPFAPNAPPVKKKAPRRSAPPPKKALRKPRRAAKRGPASSPAFPLLLAALLALSFSRRVRVT